jgi:hypothetical protein
MSFTRNRRLSPRRGTVTVIVVAFLALFAVLGLTFLIASQRYAEGSRIFREATNTLRYPQYTGGPGETPPDPQLIFRKTLGDIIFDAPDNGDGVYNSSRGHSLARHAFGANPAGFNPSVSPLANPASNIVPYSGIGKQHNVPMPAPLAATYGINTTDQIVHYVYFPNATANANFIPDPERGTTLNTLAANPITVRQQTAIAGANTANLANAPLQGNYFPVHANHTAPDDKDIYLAVVDWSTGNVKLPSFHRPHVFAQNTPWNQQTAGAPHWSGIYPASAGALAGQQNDPWALSTPTEPSVINTGTMARAANPNWTSNGGKYFMLRPRPQDHSALFPYPQRNFDGTFGDVENLTGKTHPATGQPVKQLDSLWMDFNLPVQVWQGRYYKPLVAPLIVDLDSRINVNTAGNTRFAYYPPLPAPYSTTNLQYIHASGNGWGPWEVDLPGLLQPGLPQMTPSSAMTQLQNGLQLGPTYGVNGRNGLWAATGNTFPRGPFSKRYVSYGYGEQMDSAPASGTYLPHFYSRVDFDGAPAPAPFTNMPTFPTIVSPTPGVNGRMQLPPSNLTSLTIQQFPNYGPPKGAPDAVRTQGNDWSNRFWDGADSERANHPSLHNPYHYSPATSKFLGTVSAESLGRNFGASEMGPMARRYREYDPSIYNQSDILSFAPSLRSNHLARNLITSISTDFDIAGGSGALRLVQEPRYPTPMPQYHSDFLLPGLPGTKFPVATQPNRNFNPYALSIPGPAYPTPDYDSDGPSDMDASLRSTVAKLGGVDITRPLTDYRNFTGAPYGEGNISPVSAIRATKDRQDLARDIFTRLLQITGSRPAGSINPLAPVLATDIPEYNAQRWLAQVAVNMVDHIDHDDYSTPFNWNPSLVADIRNGWVFGHELPKAVLNEVMVRYENDPLDTQITNMVPPIRASMDSIAKVWVELHNPLTPQAPSEIGQLSDNGAVQLATAGGIPSYQLQLVRPDAGPDWTATLRAADNVTGEPAAANILTPAQDFTGATNKIIQPNIGGVYTANPSFYLAAPEATMTQNISNSAEGSGLMPHAGNMTNALSYKIDNANPTMDISNNRKHPIVLLRRLTNPHIAPQPNPALPNFNPYVTVDYLTTAPNMVYDFRTHDDTAVINPVKQWNEVSAHGRRQPYRGTFQQGVMAPFIPPLPNAADPLNQQQPAGGMMTRANHTFTRHNGKAATWPPMPADPTETLDAQFDFPVHLDRVPHNMAELLHVSAFKPHEFTHEFYRDWNQTVAQPFQHTVQWYNPNTRLYRLFDLVRTGARIQGMPFGGRVPGRVNVNTMMHQPVLNAIANRRTAANPDALPAPTPSSPENGSNITTREIDVFWASLQAARGLTSNEDLWNGRLKPITGSANQPLAATDPQAMVALRAIPGGDTTPQPKNPAGTGGQNTILGAFNTAMNDPANAARNLDNFGRNELLQIATNNLTTRSNTFAIYATIGYFEVLNPGPYNVPIGPATNPLNRPILGRELGSDTNNVVRHKFFAVVDRSQLTIDPAKPTRQGQPGIEFTYEPAYLHHPLPAPVAPNWSESFDLPVSMITPAMGAAGMPAVQTQYEPDLGDATQFAYWNAASFGNPKIWLSVPATNGSSIGASNTYGGSGFLSGQYDGTPWTIVPGSTLLITDANGAIQAVAVQKVHFDATTAAKGQGLVMIELPATGTRLHRGTRVLLGSASTTVGAGCVPGNPGPQATFNYKSDLYKAVVPYVEQLE